MCPSTNRAIYPTFSGKEWNLLICNWGSKRKFNSCRIKQEEATFLDQPHRRQQWMVRNELRNRGKGPLGWLWQPCSVPNHKISIRRIPKKLKMDMTAAQRCVASRQLRCRAESMVDYAKQYPNIWTYPLWTSSRQFLSRVRAESMPTTGKVFQKIFSKAVSM